jgi:hypothetical protein
MRLCRRTIPERKAIRGRFDFLNTDNYVGVDGTQTLIRKETGCFLPSTEMAAISQPPLRWFALKQIHLLSGDQVSPQ